VLLDVGEELLKQDGLKRLPDINLTQQASKNSILERTHKNKTQIKRYYCKHCILFFNNKRRLNNHLVAKHRLAELVEKKDLNRLPNPQPSHPLVQEHCTLAKTSQEAILPQSSHVTHGFKKVYNDGIVQEALEFTQEMMENSEDEITSQLEQNYLEHMIHIKEGPIHEKEKYSDNIVQQASPSHGVIYLGTLQEDSSAPEEESRKIKRKSKKRRRRKM